MFETLRLKISYFKKFPYKLIHFFLVVRVKLYFIEKYDMFMSWSLPKVNVKKLFDFVLCFYNINLNFLH